MGRQTLGVSEISSSQVRTLGELEFLLRRREHRLATGSGSVARMSNWNSIPTEGKNLTPSHLPMPSTHLQSSARSPLAKEEMWFVVFSHNFTKQIVQFWICI